MIKNIYILHVCLGVGLGVGHYSTGVDPLLLDGQTSRSPVPGADNPQPRNQAHQSIVKGWCQGKQQCEVRPTVAWFGVSWGGQTANDMTGQTANVRTWQTANVRTWETTNNRTGQDRQPMTGQDRQPRTGQTRQPMIQQDR